jgi:hypothetical protein
MFLGARRAAAKTLVPDLDNCGWSRRFGLWFRHDCNRLLPSSSVVEDRRVDPAYNCRTAIPVGARLSLRAELARGAGDY